MYWFILEVVHSLTKVQQQSMKNHKNIIRVPLKSENDDISRYLQPIVPWVSPSTSLSLCFSIYRWMGLRWCLRSLSDALWASATQEKAAAGPGKAGARCPHFDQDRVHSQPPQHWIADSENHHCLCRVTTPCHLSGLWNCKYPKGSICMWLPSASLVILADW